MRTLASCRSPVFANDAHEYGEDPCFNRAAPAWEVVEAKLGKAPISNQEYVLHHVVDCGIVHPKPPRSAPNEFDVRVVKVSESLGFYRRRHFREGALGNSHGGGP